MESVSRWIESLSTQQRRWRLRKRHLKSDFALFQTSSPIYLICKMFLWIWILREGIKVKKNYKKKGDVFCSRSPWNVKLIAFTSLSSYDGKECVKKRDRRVKLLFFFLLFSFPLLSLLLKLCNVTENGEVGYVKIMEKKINWMVIIQRLYSPPSRQGFFWPTNRHNPSFTGIPGQRQGWVIIFEAKNLPSCGGVNGGKQFIWFILVKLVWSWLKLVPGARNCLPYFGFRFISYCSISDKVCILFMLR